MSYFSGTKKTLFKYWQNSKRVERFKSGGTRTKAIEMHLKNLLLENKVWMDVGVGAGFVQSKVEENPILSIGVDISIPMLKANKSIHKIAGSAFNLPIRNKSIDIVTNNFSISDYPDIMKAVHEFCRSSKEQISIIDYSKSDQYWQIRKELHEKIINNKQIVGNINLRDTDDLRKALPEDFKSIKFGEYTYPIDTQRLHTDFKLPPIIDRSFCFIIANRL